MLPILTDTHTHLYDTAFDTDIQLVIQEAVNNGVTQFFIPAIDSSYAPKMYALEKQYPAHIFLMTGLHPCYVKDNYLTELQFIEDQLAQRSFYAIGEIGIDLYWDKTTLDIQKIAFAKQLQLAKKYNLPVNIHCRDAFADVFEILEKEKDPNLRGIFHCFSGTYTQALQAISYGLKLGIGGVVTFKNGKIDQFLSKISLQDIVLETDSPYLAPTPHRGKRNQSSYLPLIAQKVAELYNVSVQEVASVTTQNAKAIFGL